MVPYAQSHTRPGPRGRTVGNTLAKDVAVRCLRVVNACHKRHDSKCPAINGMSQECNNLCPTTSVQAFSLIQPVSCRSFEIVVHFCALRNSGYFRIPWKLPCNPRLHPAQHSCCPRIPNSWDVYSDCRTVETVFRQRGFAIRPPPISTATESTS
jgi:hypothetical protein